MLEHRDRPYHHVLLFTQADVDSGNIIYRPPQAPSHLQELYQYSFTGESLRYYMKQMFLEHKISILEWFLKNYVILKTRVTLALPSGQ